MERGPYALGINAFVFFFSFFGLFIRALYKNGKYTSSDLAWIIPITLILISFAIYDNPFLKMVSIPILPAVFVLCYSNALLADKKGTYWNYGFIIKIIIRAVSVFGEMVNSAKAYVVLIIPASQTNKRIIVRIGAGVILFFVSALIIFIPLLSSADAVFSQKAQVITEWFERIFSIPLVYRSIVFVILSVVLFSLFAAWSKPLDFIDKEGNNKQFDSIIVGILLGGILCVYIFFLWIQFNHLWVGVLPFNFKETEQLVKSGFWQLLTLSIINIFMYFLVYRKTVPLVQKLLFAFTIVSLLLLASAGQRMGLYVAYYGFSYEKFFASYAVLYCAILFIWLITQLFRSKRTNIIKFLIMLFLWMFAVLTVFPVEQFIFRTNIALHNLRDSRIILNEMKMLSPDVLMLVKKNKEKGLLDGEGYDWNEWIREQENMLAKKAWYERNAMNVFSQLSKQGKQRKRP